MPTGRLTRYAKNGRHTIRRTASGKVSLYVLTDVAARFCHANDYGDYQRMASFHRGRPLENSEVEIILTYNAELRGLTQYHALAANVKQQL
jgi:hypothetical protein